MDDRLRQAYLYDFYGELLNEHQRRIYEDFYFNDLSLGEIAAEEGTSRQAVADMARRTAGKLEAYEEKLHLVEKFLAMKDNAQEILETAAKIRGQAAEENMNKMASEADRIVQLAQLIVERL
ncbi:MAG: DNA-binding protein [Clostridiales bacterium]|nr:DNA-binding protein [Clostridiales bacterium]